MTPPIESSFSRDVRQLRRRFLKQIEPHRAELHRFCCMLTNNVWDADDLMQDTLLRAFSKCAEFHRDLDQPRAWLFRIATHRWIDETRRRRPESLGDEMQPGMVHATASLGPEVREALAHLAERLPPRERVAVLLKDVFGFTLKEVAAFLETSVGAVKAALHRGRARLVAAAKGEAGEPAPVSSQADRRSAALLDAFVDAFNARDINRLASLFLDHASFEVREMVQEFGPDEAKDGSLHHPVAYEGGELSAECVVFDDEPIVILWHTTTELDGASRRTVRDMVRFTWTDEGIALMRYYFFCPETLEEVARRLDLPVRTNGYSHQRNV